jgi:septal ring factor EnvC (AmiA/AmiB activator)
VSDIWDIARSVVAVAAFFLSVITLFLTRRDQNQAAQKSALASVEEKLTSDIGALKDLVEERRSSTEGSIGELKTEIATITEALRHLPTVRDIDTLQSTISSVGNALAELKGAQGGIARQVELMNSFLMGNGK